MGDTSRHLAYNSKVMFKSALSPKRNPFAFLRRRRGINSAAMLCDGEIFFCDNKKQVRVDVGGKLKNVTPECVAIVPEEELFYKILSFPNNADVTSALKEAVVNLPFRQEDIIWEHEPIVPLVAVPDHNDFALWAVSREYLKNCRKTLQSAGIRIVDFLPEPIGLVKTIFPSFETTDAVLIISISSARIIFAIFAGRAIHLSGVLPFGGKTLGSGDSETETRFLSEVSQSVFWYKNRALHEHGASHNINKIFLLGTAPEHVKDRIALNVQLRVDTPDVLVGADAAFAPLIGALKKSI